MKKAVMILVVLAIANAAASAQTAQKSAQTTAEEGMITLDGHADGITSLAFSPDGKFLASGSADHEIILWDMQQFKEVRRLKGHGGVLLSLAFSPDGKWLVSGDDQHTMIQWDWMKGEKRTTYRQVCPVYHLNFLPDSRRFVSTCGENLRMWVIGNATELSVYNAGSQIHAVYITAKNEIITGGGNGTLIVWNATNGKQMLRHTRPTADRFATVGPGEDRNWISSILPLAENHYLIGDMTGDWNWNRTTDEFKLVGRNLYSAAATFSKDTLYAGGPTNYAGPGTSFWIRDLTPEGVYLGIKTKETTHTVAVSPDKQLLVYGGGGLWSGTNKFTWTPGVPSAVHIMQVSAIEKAMESYRNPQLAKWKQKLAGKPDARLDVGAVQTTDPAPKPWQ